MYEEIQAADTVGVFQIESRAQMQSLLQTRPENLDDLTVQVALVRPGPIQGKAVHPYVKHRHAKRADPSFEPPVEHESLREPLRDTLGVVVFQDQVLDVSMAAAGFSIGEAEGLRRAMSRKRVRGRERAARPRAHSPNHPSDPAARSPQREETGGARRRFQTLPQSRPFGGAPRA